MRNVQHFIDGQWVDSVDGATFESITPIDNTVIATVARGGVADADRAVEAARRAFDDGPWPRMSPTARKQILHRAAALVEERLEEFAQAETLDMGKPIAESRTKDVPRAAYNLRFFADFAEHAHTETYAKPWDNVMTYTLREPAGVAACISPWNFPLMLATWKISPALAYGNTIILKPAEQSPLTAALLAQAFADAGMPEGVVNVVQGFGPDEVGERLTEHPGVDLITFTGESATGRAIMGKAAQTLKRCSFELGGKSAAIVMADADLDRAVAGTIDGIFRNQGEVCLAGSRLFVQRGSYGEFCERYVAAAEALVVGDPREPATQVGPLVSTEHFDKVMSYIQLGHREGAKLLTGGERVTTGDLGVRELRRAHRVRRRRQLVAHRAGGDLRSGTGDRPVRRRRRGDRAGQRQPATGSPARSGRRISTPRTRSPAGCAPAPCGSTASSSVTCAHRSAA